MMYDVEDTVEWIMREAFNGYEWKSDVDEEDVRQHVRTLVYNNVPRSTAAMVACGLVAIGAGESAQA